MSASEELNLLSLLPDIIRKVINVGFEDVYNMKMISPQWNVLACEHLSNKKRLPVIAQLLWSIDYVDDHLDDSYWLTKLRVHIDERYRKYFGLEVWERQTIYDEPTNVYQLTISSYNLNSEVLRTLSKRLSSVFGRCSHIRHVVLAEDHGMNSYEGAAIINAMTYMEINSVLYKGYTGDFVLYESKISQVLRENKVGSLIFPMEPFATDSILLKFDDLLKVILKFIQLVPTIVLTSLDFDVQPPQQLVQADHDATRLEWTNFARMLTRSGKIIASLQEENLSDERKLFYITVTAQS